MIMEHLGNVLMHEKRRLQALDPEGRLARRIAEVNAMFKDAVEHLYKENASLVLAHVNAVYIKYENDAPSKDSAEGEENKETRGRKMLMVYMDDGSFRSDIHSQQHFILLWLKKNYGEDIEIFKTFPSRFGMRNRHPFGDRDSLKASEKPAIPIPLTFEEKASALQLASKVEDPNLREVFLRAMVAEKELEKGENAKNIQKG